LHPIPPGPCLTLGPPPSGVVRAVDLCAAPGSWSQVLSRKLLGSSAPRFATTRCCTRTTAHAHAHAHAPPHAHAHATRNTQHDTTHTLRLCGKRGSPSPPLVDVRPEGEEPKIVSVDLQEMAPLEGVIQIKVPSPPPPIAPSAPGSTDVHHHSVPLLSPSPPAPKTRATSPSCRRCKKSSDTLRASWPISSYAMARPMVRPCPRPHGHDRGGRVCVCVALDAND
jgi:hypothetical protein